MMNNNYDYYHRSQGREYNRFVRDKQDFKREELERELKEEENDKSNFQRR